MDERCDVAQAEVLDAARCVVNSYRATGGYTLPLSINLRRLATAQSALDAAVYVEHRERLDTSHLSDTLGFDRSVLWGDGNPEPQPTTASPPRARSSPKAKA